MSYLNTTGKRIKFLRQIRGNIAQKELAQLLLPHGISVKPSFLSQIESDSKAPPLAMLRALAQTLATTTDYLLCLSDNPELPREFDDTPGYLAPEADHVAQIVDALRDKESREAVVRVAEFMVKYEEALYYRLEAERRSINQQQWASMLAELERLEGKQVRDRIEKQLLASASGGGSPMRNLPNGIPVEGVTGR